MESPPSDENDNCSTHSDFSVAINEAVLDEKNCDTLFPYSIDAEMLEAVDGSIFTSTPTA